MTIPASNLTVRATWERTLLAAGRDEMGLLLSIAAQRPVSRLQAERAPIDVAFVLDRSGSMDGDKIELVKEAVNKAVDYLRPQDRVALVIFDNEIDVLQPLAPARAGVRTGIREVLRGVQARGGTNLSDGWLTGCQELAASPPHAGEARLQRAILLTDGEANDGITDRAALAGHAAALRQRGISTTAMGVGLGFDEVLLTGLVEAGGGNFAWIGEPGDLPAFFEQEIGGLTAIAALRPQVEITLPPGLRAHLLNMFPTSRQGKTITIDVRDLADGDEVHLMLVVTHRGRAASRSRLTGVFRSIDPQTGQRMAVELEIPALARVPDAEAHAAPLDNAVSIRRAREQSLLDQREALRLDREGRFAESRQAFAVSRLRLEDADTRAAATGYAGLTDEAIRDLRAATVQSADLAAAPAAPLSEAIHKERAANRARHSRGGRRGSGQ
jgi:Ca-activated chloride channel family protein